MFKPAWVITGIVAVCAAAGFVSYSLIYAGHTPDPLDLDNRQSAHSERASTEPLTALPEASGADARKAKLGNRLFHDPRLSRDERVACSTCHDLNKGGADGLRRSVGVAGNELAVNTPTVFNAGLNFRQFWDGRAAALEDQIDGPLLNPQEMGSTWADVLDKLRNDRDYSSAFAELYSDGVQVDTVKNAIATFERSLMTSGSRFDRYLAGNRDALTPAELQGYRLFKSYGCVACHQGVNVGGNMFQKFGIMGDYFKDRGHVTRADLGRYNVSGKDEDRHVFKVPSLRNIALTAPYFHDGSAATLEHAVALMGKYQLGLDLPPSDVAQIVEFLGTLTAQPRETGR
ncbi:MAG: hypothetical protein JWM26_1211 [Betaproteobacteria bacterium]|nr:hypothetical protein [Betaproteobacteria bacterium]